MPEPKTGLVGSYLNLPVSLVDQAAAQRAVLDRRYYTAGATQANGLCVATFPQLEADTQWLIERVAILNTSTTRTKLWMWLDSINNGPPLDYTFLGGADIADEFSPVLVPAGHQLLAQWTGGNDGDRATIRIQVRVENRPS